MTREAISAMRSEASHACPRCYEPMREIEITKGNDVDKNGPELRKMGERAEKAKTPPAKKGNGR